MTLAALKRLTRQLVLFSAIIGACRPTQPPDTAQPDTTPADASPLEVAQTGEPATQMTAPAKTCALAEPRRVELDLRVHNYIGRVGEATWAFVDGPNGRGILTVGPDGNPQVTLTPLFVEMIHVNGTTIWLGQRRPRPSSNAEAVASSVALSTPRIVPIDVSNAASPQVGSPLDLPLALPGVDTFAIGDTLALFVHQGRAFVWDRRSGETREHALGSDMGNFHSWCSPRACFVAAQTELAGLRLRLRLWRFDSTAPPSSELVADEAARDVLALPDGDARWLLWNVDNVVHARRVEADGSMPDPVHTHRPDLIAIGSLTPAPDEAGRMGVLYRLHQTGETFHASLQGPSMGVPEAVPVSTGSQITSAATTEGTLYLTWNGETRGIAGRRGRGHRWRFSGATVFRPAESSPESARELIDHSGGGLFSMNAYPIASRGGYAVVFSFGYHPWEQPSYWLLRGPCRSTTTK